MRQRHKSVLNASTLSSNGSKVKSMSLSGGSAGGSAKSSGPSGNDKERMPPMNAVGEDASKSSSSGLSSGGAKFVGGGTSSCGNNKSVPASTVKVNSGGGQGQNNSSGNSGSSAPRKKKKPQGERKDPSLLHRTPADVPLSGAHDIVNAVTSGTDELCDIIINECYVVYECKVCRNFFRNIATFFQHKKSYCTNRFAHVRNSFQDKELNEKSLIFNNGTKGHVLFSRKTSRRDILEILDKIAERRVESEPNFTAFREMCDTASALLTAFVPEKKNDERTATVTLPPPSPVRNPSSNSSHSENHNDVQQTSTPGGHELQTKVPCTKCDKDFPSKASLETHVNAVHPDVRLGYLCPCCDQIFVNSWCVNRHLTTVHKKNREEIRELRHQIEKKLVPTETLFPDRGSRRRATSFSSSNEDDSDDEKKEPEITFPCVHCNRAFLRKAAMISHRNYCRLKGPEQRVPPIHASSTKRSRSPTDNISSSFKKGKTESVVSEPRVLLKRASLPMSVDGPSRKNERNRIESIIGINVDSVVNSSKHGDNVQLGKIPEKRKSILDPSDEPEEILSCPGCHRIFLRKAAMASHAILCRVKLDGGTPAVRKSRGRRPSEIARRPEDSNVQAESRMGTSFVLKSEESDMQVFDIEDFLGVKLSSKVNIINAEDSGQDNSSDFVNKIKAENEEAEENERESSESESSGRSSASDVSGEEPNVNGENDFSESEFESETDQDGDGFEDFENTLNAANGRFEDKTTEEVDMETSNVEEEEDSAITVLGSSELEESRAEEAVASGTDIEEYSSAWKTENTAPIPAAVKREEDEEKDCQPKEFDVTEREDANDWISEKLNTFIDVKCQECLICFQRFQKISEAYNHVALHFNLKSYKCLVNSCGFRTFPSEAIVRHVIVEHKKTAKICWDFIEKLQVRPEDFPDSVQTMNVPNDGPRNLPDSPLLFNGST